MTKKASELLRASADPFDEACIKVRALEDCLEALVELKAYKEAKGKDAYYMMERNRLWRQARHLVGK